MSETTSGRAGLARRWGEALIVAAGTGLGVAAVLVWMMLREPEPHANLELPAGSPWQEVAWPFLADPWWPSKAFRCVGGRCGGIDMVYLRAKVGFCDCTKGISTDEELERVGDFRAIARSYEADRAAGRRVRAMELNGRARSFSFVPVGPDARRKRAFVVGLHSGCDALVVTAVHDGQAQPAMEEAVLGFLALPGVVAWTFRPS